MRVDLARILASFRQPLSPRQTVSIAVFFICALAFVSFFNRYKLSVNLSDSLPGKLYLVERGVLPKKGEYVEFRFEGHAYYNRGAHFVKRVAGVEGSLVKTSLLPDGRTVFTVDGEPVGVAKLYGRDGRRLVASKSREVEANQYYMAATHPDSFDSRYELFGTVKTDQIIGRAIEIF